jgi:hypothetical protein
MTFLHQKHHSKSPETETIQMPTGSKARRWWLTPVILATQDRSLKPARGNSSTRPFRKKGWWSGSRCGPEFKPQYLKKKKKKKKKKLPTEDGDIVVDYYTQPGKRADCQPMTPRWSRQSLGKGTDSSIYVRFC